MIIPFDMSLLPVVHKLAMNFHQESRYKDMPFSASKITRLLENPNGFCALAQLGDRYIGGIFGMVQPSWFSEKNIGFDLGLYIDPEYRGKSLAPVRLIKKFEEFCHTKNCIEIVLSSSSNIHEDRALRLYEKLGYTRCGFITYKNASLDKGL